MELVGKRKTAVILSKVSLNRFIFPTGGYGGGAGQYGYGGGADASCGRGAGQRGTGAGAGYGNFWTGAGVGGLLGELGFLTSLAPFLTVFFPLIFPLYESLHEISTRIKVQALALGLVCVFELLTLIILLACLQDSVSLDGFSNVCNKNKYDVGAITMLIIRNYNTQYRSLNDGLELVYFGRFD
jgi:hypothetical protein